MTNPLTQIQAAAASVGITAAVEVGDVQDLNLILDDQVEFPLVALVRVGVDGERKFLRPDGSAGYDLQWQCLLYLLDKSDIDDTGADRNTALNTLYDTALQLVSQLQIDGATSFQMQQSKRASFSAMPYNYFDLNVDGVMVAVSIPDSFAYCPPAAVPEYYQTVSFLYAADGPVNIDGLILDDDTEVLAGLSATFNGTDTSLDAVVGVVNAALQSIGQPGNAYWQRATAPAGWNFGGAAYLDVIVMPGLSVKIKKIKQSYYSWEGVIHTKATPAGAVCRCNSVDEMNDAFNWAIQLFHTNRAAILTLNAPYQEFGVTQSWEDASTEYTNVLRSLLIGWEGEAVFTAPNDIKFTLIPKEMAGNDYAFSMGNTTGGALALSGCVNAIGSPC